VSLVIGPSDYFRLVYKRRPLNRNPDNKCDRGAVICFETSVQAINQSINQSTLGREAPLSFPDFLAAIFMTHFLSGHARRTKSYRSSGLFARAVETP